MSSPSADRREWLEADGLGGFASGTASGVRTRRYHALLLAATTPPTGRVVLVNGFDAWVETPNGRFALTSQAYAPGVIHPNGAQSIEIFAYEPWPQWTYLLPDGTRIVHEIIAEQGASAVAVTWRLVEARDGVRLAVRPFLSGRDYHGLHHENPALRFEAQTSPGRVGWQPYESMPRVLSLLNGSYEHQPDWYRNFQYDEERERGLDFQEDLAAPGILRWDLSSGEAVWIVGAVIDDVVPFAARSTATSYLKRLRSRERQRRQAFASPLRRAGDAYVVQREGGKTIVAGYPWFTDWGRDTFIALRGICLATGELDTAREVLLEWSGAVSEGMLPNRFADAGDAPEFNAVDASLWFVTAAHEFLAAAKAAGKRVAAADLRALQAAVEAILCGYAAGTRYGIRLDDDGLIAAGAPGVQLTWMDAKVGDWVVTPRAGKPVEVQALWLNAARIGSQWNERWAQVFERGRRSFVERFWDVQRGWLADVIDVDHQAGMIDARLRPNQILAVGGLPLAVIDGEAARRVVDAVEAKLWTPLGLRSLAPDEAGYVGHYTGGVRERDGCYHQGTVWPWLMGAFIDAWVKVRGAGAEAKREASERFVTPLLRHLDDAGLGHVSEIADAEPPFTPRGCPFQAWSVGELIRVQEVILR